MSFTVGTTEAQEGKDTRLTSQASRFLAGSQIKQRLAGLSSETDICRFLRPTETGGMRWAQEVEVLIQDTFPS